MGHLRSDCVVTMRALLVCALFAAGCNLHQFFDDPRCYTTADCDGGKICSANLCVGVGTLGTGRKCWATRDCQDGQTCQLVPDESDMAVASTYSQRCLAAGSGAVGAVCTSSLDCAAGLRCDLVGFSGTCANAGTTDYGGACSTTADCLAGLACGPSAACLPYPVAYPQFAGVTCSAETAPFRAHFEVAHASDFFSLPFPTDIRRDGSTLDLSAFPRPGPTFLGVDLVALYADALASAFDGFSAIAPITFRFSAPVDASTLAGAATLVDLTAALATPGTGIVPSRTLSYPAPTKFSCADRVVVEHEASTVLLPKHTYGVVLRGIAAESGAVAVQDSDLSTMLASTRPSDATLGRAWDLHQSLRTWLAQAGIAPTDVQAATVFTVADATSTVREVRDVVEGAALPILSDVTVCGTGVPSPCADGGPDRVCGLDQADYVEVQGRIAMPIFQTGTEPYAQSGGRVSPAVIRTEQVCFELIVPRGTMPTSGWPLLVYHHDTGGSFRSLVTDGVAEPLAAGSPAIASFSFDAIEHGARKGGSALDSNTLVFDIANPDSALGNAQQDAADVLTALRVAGLTVTLAGSTVSFDPRVTYFGHSQGGNAGLLGLAYEPVARAAVLSGAGGGIVDGVLGKTQPLDLAADMQQLFNEPLDVAHPAMVLLQTYFDPSDPEVYAPLLVGQLPAAVPAKSVLHTFGLGDTYAPDRALANVTKALGVPLVAPVLQSIDDGWPAWLVTERPVIADIDASDGSSITAATFQYDPMGAYDGHLVALQDAQAVSDWKAFLQTYFVAGTPHVP